MSAAPFPLRSLVRVAPHDRVAEVVGAGDVLGEEVRLVQYEGDVPVQAIGLARLTEFTRRGLSQSFQPTLRVTFLDGRVTVVSADWSDSTCGDPYDEDAQCDVLDDGERNGLTSAFDRDVLGFPYLDADGKPREQTPAEQAAAFRRIADLIDGDESLTVGGLVAAGYGGHVLATAVRRTEQGEA